MRGIERIFIRRADEQEVCTLRLRVFLHERKISRRTPKLALRHRVCAGVIGQGVGVIPPAIRAEQQFDYVTGKNTTDIAMVIGAMDLLHNNMYDALVLVSSDSDFTPLAIRLRESGLYIIGAGVTTTPESFKNACDDFILIDYLAKADDKPAVEHTAEPAAKKPATRKAKKTVRSTKKPAAEPTPAAEPEPAPKKPDIREIHNLLHIASEKYQDADGFVNVSSSGLYIKRVKPDFNVRAYGYSKLPELLAAFPNKYQIKRYEGKGGATIIAYKCL